jgi:hypothetical protein
MELIKREYDKEISLFKTELDESKQFVEQERCQIKGLVHEK